MSMEKETIKKEYEISYLVREEGDRQELVKLLNSYKAEILNEGKISKITLAYPIKKEKSAYFGFFVFAVEPEMIKEVKEKLKLNNKVLRSLIITPPIEQREKRVIIKLGESIRPAKPKKQPVFEEEQLKIKKEEAPPMIDNELLEKKLEEILK